MRSISIQILFVHKCVLELKILIFKKHKSVDNRSIVHTLRQTPCNRLIRKPTGMNGRVISDQIQEHQPLGAGDNFEFNLCSKYIDIS